MKFEISHDLIAQQVYHKISADDKARLWARQFIVSRAEPPKAERILLNRRELDFIAPHYENIKPDLNQEERDYVKASQDKLNEWKKYFAYAAIAALVLFFLSSTAIPVLMWKLDTITKSAIEGARNDSIKALTILYQLDSLERVKNYHNEEILCLDSEIDQLRGQIGQPINVGLLANLKELLNAKEMQYLQEKNNINREKIQVKNALQSANQDLEVEKKENEKLRTTIDSLKRNSPFVPKPPSPKPLSFGVLEIPLVPDNPNPDTPEEPIIITNARITSNIKGLVTNTQEKELILQRIGDTIGIIGRHHLKQELIEMDLSNEGTILATVLARSGEGQEIKIWKVGQVRGVGSPFTEQSRWPLPDSVHQIDLSPDGKRIVYTLKRDPIAYVWTTGKDAREIAQLVHGQKVNMAVFSPDGQQIGTASNDKTGRIWETNTFSEVKRVHHSAKVYAVAFSPECNRFATASLDKTARVYDLAGKELNRFTHYRPVIDLGFYMEGCEPEYKQYLTTVCWDSRRNSQWTHNARVWDLNKGNDQVRRYFWTPTRLVAASRFSADGNILLTDSGDQGSAVMWSTDKRKAYLGAIQDQHKGKLTAIGYSLDSNNAVSASNDGLILLWDFAKFGTK